MPALHVRDLPPELIEALKRRAAAHHRSLQGELHAILESAAKQAPPAEPLAPIRLTLAATSPESTWQRGEIYDDEGR